MITGAQKQHVATDDSPGAAESLEMRKYCAYNQTRECFLGLEVRAADLSVAHSKDRIATLALKSGEGLWMAPFRGMPETGMRSPIDLIFLDENSRVIEVVESFPVCAASSRLRATSVLALPIHSIYSSQTQPGDQLVVCVAEEMKSNLERFSSSNNPGAAVDGVAVLREIPLWSGGPGLLQLEDRSSEELPKSQEIHEIGLIEPGTKTHRPPKSWLERWWSPDPRKAPREPAPGMAAYYWNGSAPKAHNIKDISSSGLYVVTEERWYPGTLVMMTLQRADGDETNAERSISVHSRAVRWGTDGVGLQFALSKSNGSSAGLGSAVDGVDKKELDRFLHRLRMGNGS